MQTAVYSYFMSIGRNESVDTAVGVVVVFILLFVFVVVVVEDALVFVALGMSNSSPIISFAPSVAT